MGGDEGEGGPLKLGLVMFHLTWAEGHHPLPPPWFIPIEAPACGAELHVPAEDTNDGIARHFVCDVPAGDHRPEERHRQVTDNEKGTAFTWPM